MQHEPQPLDPRTPVASEGAPQTLAAAPVDPEGPIATAGVFRALRHPNYRLWFFGQLISQTGWWIQVVAQGWLVLKLTNSPMMLGVVAFASTLPIMLLSLFAGVIVDRVDRRRLLLATQSTMTISALTLAAITFAGVVRVEHIILLAALTGCANAFDMPGRQAFTIEMVGGLDELPGAIALNSMVMNGARSMGPALGGLLLPLISESGCFFVNGITYLAIICNLLRMKVIPRKLSRSNVAIFAQLRQGLSYVFNHHAIFYLLVTVALGAGLGLQYNVLVPVFARNILHGNARLYGLLVAFNGMGAVMGSALLSARGRDPRRIQQHLLSGAFCLGASVLVFGLSSFTPLSIIAMVLAGTGMINYLASTNTLVQLFLAEEFRGRVMSVYTVALMGTMPLGGLLAGFLGEHVSPQFAVSFCGVMTLCCGLFLLTRLKIFRAAAQAIQAAL